MRNEKAIEPVPSLLVFAYTMLLLAEHRIYKPGDKTYPKPKWQQEGRVMSSQFVSLFRAELWGKAIANRSPKDWNISRRLRLFMRPDSQT
ncbi:hypothetical protein [Desulfovibrio inopinatus]|uniref:hypothetical protein n=1 Tax=Desulfovibrio inopinatus TaxID=102109 RepID=UPI0004850BA0|nr:hypothetical protein [Desulfovibrio inopinatus]